MNLQIDIQGTTYSVAPQGSGWIVNGKEIYPELVKTDEHTWHLLAGDTSYRVLLHETDPAGKFVVFEINGKKVRADISNPMDLLLKTLGIDNSAAKKVKDLKAPMPGLIREVKIKEGDILQPGDPVLILEAMKMENVLKAPAELTVKSLKVQAGDKVEKNAVLVVFE